MIVLVLIRDENDARLFERQMQTLVNAEEIVIIPDTDKALQYLEAHPADAVFIDIDGESDWQNICGMVKYADRTTSLVLLSSNPLNAVKAFEAGASDFLPKPVEWKRLVKALGRCARAG